MAAAEEDGITTHYLRGADLAASETEGRLLYYLHDAHGDVTEVVDASGNSLASYEYDAFGNEQDPDAEDPNPFRYCGEYWDIHTNALYLRARDYKPGIGRFLSQDTHWNTGNRIYGDEPGQFNQGVLIPDIRAMMQSGNLYVYCGNNPVIFIDHNGEIVGTITGAVIGGAIGGISAVAQGKDIWTGVASGVVSGAFVGVATDIIIATGGAGLVAVGATSAAGAFGGAAASVIDQFGNQWRWGSGTKFSESVGLIKRGEVLRSAFWGIISGGLAGATSQALSIAQKTSVELYKYVLAQPTINTIMFDAVGKAIIRSATNSFMIDAATGAVYSILTQATELLTSSDIE
jgi:RHS repeat-associated protein